MKCLFLMCAGGSFDEVLYEIIIMNTFNRINSSPKPRIPNSKIISNKRIIDENMSEF